MNIKRVKRNPFVSRQADFWHFNVDNDLKGRFLYISKNTYDFDSNFRRLVYKNRYINGWKHDQNK